MILSFMIGGYFCSHDLPLTRSDVAVRAGFLHRPAKEGSPAKHRREEGFPFDGACSDVIRGWARVGKLWNNLSA